jgi:hypothetical protein
MATAINGVVMNTDRRSTFRKIPNGTAYFLQTAANLFASASDVCFNKRILDAVMHHHPVTDDDPAFDEYFNLVRQVSPMCMDLCSLQPTYITFQCSYVLQIAAPTKPIQLAEDKKKPVKRKRDGEHQNDGTNNKQNKTPPVDWIELINRNDKSWRISEHKFLFVEGSHDPTNILCWNHVAAGRICKVKNCKYRHPSTPATICNKSEVQRLIEWVRNDPTIRWVGEAKKDIQQWITSA